MNGNRRMEREHLGISTVYHFRFQSALVNGPQLSGNLCKTVTSTEFLPWELLCSYSLQASLLNSLSISKMKCTELEYHSSSFLTYSIQVSPMR